MADLQSHSFSNTGAGAAAAMLLSSDSGALQIERPEPPRTRLVTFMCDSPTAEVVAIAGTFTNWQPIPMYRDITGVWGIAQRLLPGEYEYRVMIDGQWRSDPANPRKAVNRYGAENSLLTVH